MACVIQPGGIAVKPVETDDEMCRANEFMARTCPGRYEDNRRWLDVSGVMYPGFRREHTRIALANGDLAGALRIATETMRLGEARLKAGVLSWAAVSPHYSGTTVLNALLCDAFNYMAAQRYHVALAFGASTMYRRLGFADVFNDCTLTMPAETFYAPRTNVRLRSAKPGDIAAIQRIHQTNNADIPCSLLRTTAHLTNKWERWPNLNVLTNAQGNVLAYFAWTVEEDLLVVYEIGIADLTRPERILAECAEIARTNDLAHIRFMLPPDHPLHPLLSASHEVAIDSCENAGLLSIVDAAETIEMMFPEWETRLERSAFRDERIECTFIVGDGRYRIRANRGALDVAPALGINKFSLSRSDFVGLLVGAAKLEDLLAAHYRIVTPAARSFLSVLFPARSPYVWWFDRR